MRLLKLIFILGVLLAIVLLLATIYVFFIRPLTLPVYHMDQQPSTQRPDFSATTLTLGSSVFISDASEFPLEMLASFSGKWNMIGRTQDGLDIYSIPGEDPQNYIMLTGDMFPRVIFRNAALPPLMAEGAHFDALRMLPNFGSGPHWDETRDPVVVKAVIDRLVYHESDFPRFKEGNAATLYLVSDSHPGLGYMLYVSTSLDGSALLSTRVSPDDLFFAGSVFDQWFKDQFPS